MFCLVQQSQLIVIIRWLKALRRKRRCCLEWQAPPCKVVWCNHLTCTWLYCVNIIHLQVGGTEEYKICEAIKDGRITKKIVCWCIGTCAKMFNSDVSVSSYPFMLQCLGFIGYKNVDERLTKVAALWECPKWPRIIVFLGSKLQLFVSEQWNWTRI